MTFYGSGCVYNRAKKRADIRFVDGVFETEDPEQIERLKECGFKYDDPEPVKVGNEIIVERVDTDPLDGLSKSELVELAEGLAAPSTLKRYSVEKLKGLINEYSKNNRNP